MRAVRKPTLLLPLLLLSALAAACGDDGAGTGGGEPGTGGGPATGNATGNACPDGVIEDGDCVGKCTPETCSPGNTCVGNRCSLLCDGHADCYPGTSCGDAVEDDTGAAIRTCAATGKAPILGAICYFGNECDAWTVCPDGTACGASLCGGQACTDGACPDGTPCAPQSCDAAACRSPRCLGAVEDPAQSPSATSFCSQDDCTTDADCAGGLVCGQIRDFHEICGRDDVELGTETPCIDPSEFATDGKTYQEGTVSLLRNVCLRRRQCSPCVEDLDCSGVPGLLCAQIGGESRCATQCAADGDCEADATCEEDPAHPGVLVCTPRFGACAGDGNFCEPCVNDLDCGEASGSFACIQTAGAQRACFDLTFPDECTTDDDCPVAPDGELHGECMDAGEQVPTNDPIYHRCYFPYFESSNRFQCW